MVEYGRCPVTHFYNKQFTVFPAIKL